MNDCIFCKIAARRIPSQNVYEDESAAAFKDLNPQAPVHILIVPKKHISGLDACRREDAALLGHLQLVAAKLAAENGIAGGYRLLTNNGRGAGQSVDHLHYHLLGGRPLAWPPG
ncbi:MAG: histidine triad nucleotide-binding protein [Elusimicrobia bacterium]|nr:histidine triad nucleotide-binding protein [Elusimicrobiota bacterium]